ncbi:MAG: hypothetical protein H0T97_08655 [Actinobacteria bacterium]|nr:hypothetical protein [Actinomycetota bacterium]
MGSQAREGSAVRGVLAAGDTRLERRAKAWLLALARVMRPLRARSSREQEDS